MLKRLSTGWRSLRVRILAIVTLCWLLPLVVLGIYTAGVIAPSQLARTQDALVSGATNAQTLVTRSIEDLLDKSKNITYDGILTDATAAYQAGEITYEDFYTETRDYWQRLFQREPMVSFTVFFLTDEPDKMLNTATDINDLLAFRANVLPQMLEMSEELDTRSRFIYIDNTLYHVRNLVNRRMERFGMIALAIDPDQLLSALRDERLLYGGKADIALDQYTYVADSSYPFSLRTFQEGLYDADGNLYYGHQVKTSDYTLTYRVRLPHAAVYGQLNVYYGILLVLALLGIPVVALLALYLRHRLTRPLAEVTDATKQLTNGKLGDTVTVQQTTELAQLDTAFNAMSLHMQRLIDKTYKEEIALRDARIAALQGRINPRFLGSTLAQMHTQAQAEGAPVTGQMAEAMRVLLGAALDRSNQRTVPLQAELAVVDAYMFLLKQRFGDALTYTQDIDAALLPVQVPRLAIQIVLENAVDHSIEPADGGAIHLGVYQRDGKLYIDVRSGGYVLSAQELANVTRALEDSGREEQGEYTSIRNVNMRLRLLYNGQASLSVSAEEDGATLTRITLPHQASLSE